MILRVFRRFFKAKDTRRLEHFQGKAASDRPAGGRPPEACPKIFVELIRRHTPLRSDSNLAAQWALNECPTHVPGQGPARPEKIFLSWARLTHFRVYNIYRSFGVRAQPSPLRVSARGAVPPWGSPSAPRPGPPLHLAPVARRTGAKHCRGARGVALFATLPL